MSESTLRRLPSGCFFFVACLLTPAVAFAQSELASVYGRVTDQAGAVIVGADVEIKNVETNVSVIRTTNEDGLYTIPSLHPGHYVISARKPGFKTVTVTQLVLNVQDNVIRNFTLQVGSVSESITVTAGSLNMNTMDGSVSTVVDRQFVENLPLNGRSFQALIALTPGVVLTKANFNEQGQFSVNGQRADANYFTVDGVSANIGASTGNGLEQTAGGSVPGLSVLGGTNNLVSVDALQEFRIQTSSYAPEFGRTPGGQISIVTRSGTNEFHGTLFDYFRNDALDATDWFNNRFGLKKPAERQNDFGGVLGGPILKDHTFFFLSYEGLRLRLPQTQIKVVPSVASRQAAPSQIQPLLNAFPIPNGPDLGSGVAQFAASYSDPATLNATSIRVDHTFSSKLSLFGRYNYAPSRVIQRGLGSNTLSVLNSNELNTQTVTLGLTHNLSSRISSELRANYSKTEGVNVSELDSFSGATPPPDSLLFPSFASRQNSLFSLNITGAGFLGVGKNSDNQQHQVNLVENLSVLVGSHQLKFGLDYRGLRPLSGPRDYSQAVTFSGITGPTGALAGNAQSVSINAARSVRLLSQNVSAYAQDTWKATSRLTLTYGLRWDINPPLRATGRDNLLTVQGLDNPPALMLAPAGTPLYHTTYGNFAPRAGLAYQLTQRHGREAVLRGGFGVFYDLGSGSLGHVTGFGLPFISTKFLSNVPFPLTPAQAAPPPFSLNPPIFTMIVSDPNLRLPRTYQWNIAIERSLGPNQTVAATYLAGLGRKLLRQDALLNPNPNFLLVNVTRNVATSDYHALQLQFVRRLSHGLQVQTSYSWSHSIDIASNDSFTGNFPLSKIDLRQEQGSSDFDVRHVFATAVTYNFPAPAVGKLAAAILRDWALDTFITARSATPVNLVGSLNFTGGFFAQARPDLTLGIALYLSDPNAPGGKRFNDTVDPSRPGCKGPFCPAPQGRQGTFGRNVLRGFGAAQVDLALRRQFHLTERLSLQFRIEGFNIFNHPNFGDPGANFDGANRLSSPLFGQSTQTLARSLGGGIGGGGFNPLYQVGGPRSMQLALKLQF